MSYAGEYHEHTYDWNIGRAYRQVTAERDTLLAKIEKVRALHVRTKPDALRCGECGAPENPCPTIKALGGLTDG